MSTTLRNCSFLDPTDQTTSVRGVAAAMNRIGAISVRDLMSARQPPTQRWAVVILTFGGAPRTTSLMPTDIDRVFGDLDGVASFFRRMSGGRTRIEWQAFGPFELVSIARKRELSAKSAEDGAYRELMKDKADLSDFDRVMWVCDESQSTGGTTPYNSFVGAQSFCASLVAHEISHTFGAGHSGRETKGKLDEYGSPYCIMGMTPGVFSSSAETMPSPHDQFGPGMCTVQQQACHWLDPAAHASSLNSIHEVRAAVGRTFRIWANQGAPQVPFYQTALVLSLDFFPRWYELRVPRRADRSVASLLAAKTPVPMIVCHRAEPPSRAIFEDETPATVGYRTALVQDTFRFHVAALGPDASWVDLTLESLV